MICAAQADPVVKKATVYTRTGDQGTSQLLSVGRVPKDHLRLVVYGDTDELNSVIGVAIAENLATPLDTQLAQIQAELFVLGSQIAVPNPENIKYPIPQMAASHTDNLESWIDELDAVLPALKNFVLPGGSRGAAQLHHARTVCRRCERHMQSLHHQDPLSAPALTYINRLSDFLFIAARFENFQQSIEDIPWKS